MFIRFNLYKSGKKQLWTPCLAWKQFIIKIINKNLELSNIWTLIKMDKRWTQKHRPENKKIDDNTLKKWCGQIVG